MTDVHSHVLYGIDDGSKNIDESIELLKKLSSVGFTNVIATPHYIEGSEYACVNKEKLKIFNTLKKRIKKENININLYLGNEVFVNKHMAEDIKENKIYTLNNSKYLLFELSFHDEILNLPDIIYELKLEGYTPILAHPERYVYFWKNRQLLDDLKKEGLLFQANYSSILGYYGKHCKKQLKYLLKKGYIDYLGTDIHHIKNTYVIDNFEKIKKKFIKIIGEDNFNKIQENNNELIK